MSHLYSPRFDVAAVISRLFVYPIKSCAGVQVPEALLTETGLEFDRAWMVVDGQGAFLTQRQLPRMALVRPQLKHFEMVLRAPGMLALHVKLDEVEAPVRVRVWDDEVAAFDMGATAAQWFSDFLGTTARLVRFDPEHKRLSSPTWTGNTEALNQFSDGFPVLVLSDASLSDFNARLAAAGNAPVGMERFRPNIVLSSAVPGAAADGHVAGDTANWSDLAPHDEDRLDVLHVTTEQGIAQLKLVKPCARCPIPNIDPATGLSAPHVGDMLQTYRHDARVNGAVTFGMNAIVLTGIDHVLKAGQEVNSSYRFA